MDSKVIEKARRIGLGTAASAPEPTGKVEKTAGAREHHRSAKPVATRANQSTETGTKGHRTAKLKPSTPAPRTVPQGGNQKHALAVQPKSKPSGRIPVYNDRGVKVGDGFGSAIQGIGGGKGKSVYMVRLESGRTVRAVRRGDRFVIIGR